MTPEESPNRVKHAESRAVASAQCRIRAGVAAAIAAMTVLGASGEQATKVASIRFDSGLGRYKSESYKDRLVLADAEFKGERCLNVSAREKVKPEDTAWSIRSGRFPVTPGKAYAVNVRSAGSVNMMATFGGTRIEWFDAGGKALKTVNPLGKTVDLVSEFGFRCRPLGWCETVTRGIVPEGAAFGDLHVGSDNPNICRNDWISIAFVDYYEAKSAEELVFTGDYDPPVLKSFTPSGPSADFSATIVLEFSDPSGIDAGSVRVTLDGEDVSAKFARADGKDVWTYRHPKEWEEGSLHWLTISASDAKGNEMKVDRAVYFTKKPISHPKYEVRDDGMILRDGRPFFVMSIFAFGFNKYNGGKENAMREMEENGYTLLSSYMRRDNWAKDGHFDVFAAAAAEHGYPICVQLAELRDLTDPVKRDKRDKIAADAAIWGRSSAAAGFWELGDDTASCRHPGSVARDNMLVKAIDDYALTTQSDIAHEPGRYFEFAHHTDVFRIEVYPMRAETPQPAEMASLKHDLEVAYFDLARSGAKNRSLWSIPQAFEGWGMWKRFPSYEELRAETFISIACRMRGIAYYTYASGEWGARVKPETWADLCKVTREVMSIKDDLASRDAASQPKVEIVAGPARDERGGFPVAFLLKETGLLVAASSSSKPVMAKFTMPDGTVFSHEFPRNGVLVRRGK